MAKKWLALRGSVSHSLWLQRKEKISNAKTINPDTTNVNFGLSLLFGDFVVDGLIGTYAGNANTGSDSEDGSISLDKLMTRAAITYKF